MALVLTEEQTMLRDSARGFLSAEAPVAHLRSLRDQKDAKGYSPALWQRCTEMGFAGVLVPEAHGGLGLTLTDAAVIEIDPVAGGDEARDTVRRLHELRLETRQRPDGAHEIVGLHRREGETVGATRPAAQALRVLHAPGHIATPRATIRNKPGAIAERAQRWRAQTHATHQRIMRGKP